MRGDPDRPADDETTIRPPPGEDSFAPPAASPHEPGSFVRGAAVGRYVLLDRIGAGGMGHVFAAYDPELDRKVAIKLVASGGFEGELRLLREAQALARLAHPNVVAIHDVGVQAAHVWIAMEFVAGETLDVWARAAPRPWRALLDVLLAAARGVAAAHAAGLVHRDLKPDNVMVSPDGRVRVMDFGLVHDHDADPHAERLGPAVTREALAGVALTGHGELLGTPAYMAPEQWRGDPAAAPADQYSWSVMAWELLLGERPFTGESREALREAVLAGRRRPPPRGHHVPTWLRRVLERGLASDPRQRWQDMAALVSALGRGQSIVRRRVALALMLTLAAFVGLALGLQRWRVAQQRAACEAAGAEIHALWNDETRQTLRAAFAATAVDYAATAAARTDDYLDAQATAWQAARTAVCHADQARTWRDDVGERALWCLEERRFELSSLVDTLLHADARTVQSAVDAASKLVPVAPCIDEAQLLRGPPPPRRRDEVQALRVALAQAGSLAAIGRPAEALAAAAAAREQADQTAWPALQAAARVLEARLHLVLRSSSVARRLGRDAYMTAARADAWQTAAEAAMLLMDAHLTLAHLDEVRSWADNAEIAISHAGDPTSRLEARRLGILALAAVQAGALDEALTRMTAALALEQAALGSGDHPAIAVRLNLLAFVRSAREETTEALALYRRALAMTETTLGPTHPDAVMTLHGIAQVHLQRREFAEALPLLRRMLARQEATHGPTYPDLSSTLGQLAMALTSLGESPEAIALARRGLALAEPGAEQAPFAFKVALDSLAQILAASGDLAGALPLHERLVALTEKMHGPEDPSTMAAVAGLARVLTELGDYPRASALYARIQAHPPINGPLWALLGNVDLALRTHDIPAARDLLARAQTHTSDPGVTPDLLGELHEALGLLHTATGEHTTARADFTTGLALTEQVYGPDHPFVAHHLVRLAGAWLAEQQPAQALPLLERAFSIGTTARPHTPRDQARLHFYLARALVDTHGDRARALAAAETARAGFHAPGDADELAAVQRWLAKHRTR